jgi:Ca-activated chloride channel homolog
LEFAFPQYWIWTLAIPVSMGIIFLVYRRVDHITRTWFGQEEYKRNHPLLKFVLRAVAFVFLFIALVGPYWREKERKVSIMGREIYLLLDVSSSMNAQDIRPSRLEKARQELKQLVYSLRGDKIGLIVFSEYAYVQCPLTRDYRAVSLFLDMVETDQFAQTGTQFRSSLATALERMTSVEGRSDNVNRAIVLVSDGEDYGDTYASIIDRLLQSNIKVFTVGIGTPEGAPVPQFVNKEQQGYKTYPDGSTAISRLLDEHLIDIAQQFGTEYIAIDAPYKRLDGLVEQLLLLTSSPLESKIEKVENNHYQLFLFVSLFCLLFSLFLMPIRKS